MDLSPFDPLERAAVLIGRGDPLPYFASRAPPPRLLRAIFGIAPVKPLANPRLDALRRLVIALRRSPGDVSEAVAAARAAGVRPDHADHLVAIFGIAMRNTAHARSAASFRRHAAMRYMVILRSGGSACRSSPSASASPRDKLDKQGQIVYACHVL